MRPPVDETAARWREALLMTMEPYRGRPLLLSGGMDSTTLLAAQLELGGWPRCYAYRLGDRESEDLLAARALCDALKLELVTVPIPEEDEHLLALTRKVIRNTRNPRKTAVQCCWGIAGILNEALLLGDRTLLIGTGGIAEDNRKAQTWGARYATDPAARQALEEARYLNLRGGNPDSATETMKRFAALHDVTLLEPYSMEPLAAVGLSIPWPEMNWPVQKGIACRAFPDFFDLAPPEHDHTFGRPRRYWRKNSSLQVNGGIREHHDRLLKMPINRRGAERVVAVYNDILVEETNGEQLGLV